MKTIALDIGKVCIDIHPERCFQALGFSPDIEVPNDLWQSIKDMENGFIDEKAWLKAFQKVTGNKFSDDKLRNAYCMILGNEKKEAIDFVIQVLSKDIRVIFFSDTSPIHINQLFRNLSFANLISGGVYSFETGCSKPDPEMYREFEKNYGTPLIYIDDKEENISAGMDAGWNSIIYESPETFNKASALLGL